ncbi:MAG: hypothetical protein IJ927_00240, partial [Eubacterium sp.]|nr:hypothetical protein [Eubacterium sp.]
NDNDGIKSTDGIAYINNLKNYLVDGKDIDIRFTMAVNANQTSNSKGIFSIGSAYVDSGSNSTANDLVYWRNDGDMRYKSTSSNTDIRIGTAESARPNQYTYYDYRIYFDYSVKRIYIYRNNELKGSVQDNAINKNSFGVLVIGAHVSNNFGNNAIKSISVSQPDVKDAGTVETSTVGSGITKQSVTKSTGFCFNGTNTGAVKQNILYPDTTGNAEAGGKDQSGYYVDMSNNSNTRISYKVHQPNSKVVYLYKGDTSVIKLPTILEIFFTGGENKGHAWNYISVNGSWTAADSWYSCNSWNKMDRKVSAGSVNDLTIISTDSSHNHPNYSKKNSGGCSETTSRSDFYVSNTLVYSGTISNNSYLVSLTAPTITASMDSYGWSDSIFNRWNGEWEKSINDMAVSTRNIKVLNYKPLCDVIDTINGSEFQTLLTDVNNNDWKYTEDSKKKFYAVLSRVKNFDITAYDYSNDIELEASADEMKSIVNAFNTYGTPSLNNFTITYVDKNDSSSTATVLAGNTLANKTSGAAVPSLPAAEHVSNNKHNTYSWSSEGDNVASSTTAPTGSHEPHSNETYTVETTLVSCTPSEELSEDSDGSTHNGYKYHECTVCHHETSRTYNALDWDTYDDNLDDYTDAIESDLYTDDSKTTCTTAVTAAISGINRGTMTGANTPQSTVNTAATAISDALANLKGRAAFGALDAAKTTAMNWANDSARAAEYTSSSIKAYKDYLDSTTVFPFENTASRTNTPATDENNAAISAEKTAYENAQTYAIANILDPLADLTTLESAYEEGDSILKSLVGKTAQYDAASVQALIDAVEDANDSEYIGATAEEKADFGTVGENSDQDKADDLADDINNAINGLTLAAVDSTTGKAVDTSVFDSLVNTLNNLDPDAYEENEGGSLASAKSTINSLYGTATQEYEGETINVVNGITSQDAADTAANKIQTALTVCTKKYTITRSGVTDFGINNGTEEGGKVNYGATLTCRSGDDETAWFIEVQTGSMHKKYTFQSYGKTLKTKVLGTTTVNAVKRDATNNCRIMITRSYGDDREPIQYASFVPSGTEFTLPAAPSIAYTTFNGYSYKNGSAINTATITVTEDVDIVANYTESDASCAINATDINSVAHNSTVKYNEKVELDGGAGTYGWIEQVGTTYRPFYKGQKVSFLATESTTLLAVNQATFDSYGKAPIINLRKGGVIVSDSKYIFNAQLVPGNADVREYGILIAAPSDKNGATPIAPANSQIIVENSGQHEGYAILRAKSTKLVGANQFSIAVNNLPSGYKYRGYVIYHDGSSLQTVYTDIH